MLLFSRTGLGISCCLLNCLFNKRAFAVCAQCVPHHLLLVEHHSNLAALTMALQLQFWQAVVARSVRKLLPDRQRPKEEQISMVAAQLSMMVQQACPVSGEPGFLNTLLPEELRRHQPAFNLPSQRQRGQNSSLTWKLQSEQHSLRSQSACQSATK